jgi:hypothetical protein
LNFWTAEADLAFLDLEGGGDARDEAGLVLGEEDGDGVRADLLLAGVVPLAVVRRAVDEDELGVRILVLGDEDRGLELEAGAHDELEAGVVEVADLLHVVGLGGAAGLEVLGLVLELLAGLEHAFPGSLVEGLIVDGSGIGDHADGEALGGGEEVLAADEDGENGEDEYDSLHMLSFY